jgi:hypothetical protein
MRAAERRETMGLMTWETRDLPVLKAIVELSDEGVHYIKPDAIAERTGLDKDQVQLALLALNTESPPYFTPIEAGAEEPLIIVVKDVTGSARRAVGTWPTGERLAKQIIEGLRAAAEAEPEEEKRSRLQQTIQFLDNAGWGVLLGVAGNIASKGLGY